MLSSATVVLIGSLVFFACLCLCRYLYSLTPYGKEAKRQEEAQEMAREQAAKDASRRWMEKLIRAAQEKAAADTGEAP